METTVAGLVSRHARLLHSTSLMPVGGGVAMCGPLSCVARLLAYLLLGASPPGGPSTDTAAAALLTLPPRLALVRPLDGM